MVDPNANQKMTFSEIVHLLSNHKVPKSEDSMQLVPLLEKFANIGGIEADVNDAFNAVMGSSQNGEYMRENEEEEDIQRGDDLISAEAETEN